jgi:hypothetical protein
MDAGKVGTSKHGPTFEKNTIVNTTTTIVGIIDTPIVIINNTSTPLSKTQHDHRKPNTTATITDLQI